MKLNDAVELNLAADSGMMLVVRLTTAGVIARAGLTMDVMDSLKMATEEACNCLIGQENPPKRIGLCFRCEDDRLKIAVRALDGVDATGSADENELEVVRCILESLADEVSIDARNGWIRSVELEAALA